MSEHHFKYDIGEQVYVIDWGRIYTTGEKFDHEKQEWKNLFDFKRRVKNFYCKPIHFVRYTHRPKLTKKGTPYKNGAQVMTGALSIYEDWMYEVVERCVHPNRKDKIYLIQPVLKKHKDMGALFQVNENALSKHCPEEYERLSNEEFESQHLNRYTPEDFYDSEFAKSFPERLTEKIYDKDQNVLFGSKMTKGIVYYVYVPAKFMKTGRDYILSSGITYNGVGCDLSDVRSAHYHELKELFPDNSFE